MKSGAVNLVNSQESVEACSPMNRPVTKSRVKVEHPRRQLAGSMRFNGYTSVCFVWTALLCLAGTVFALPPLRATRRAITAASPFPSVAGQPVRVGFQVAPTVPIGSLTPSGDVWVTGAGQCKAPVEAGGCSLIISEAGTATLTASYYGDRNFLPSTSTKVICEKVIDFSIPASPSSPFAEATAPGQKTSYQVTLAPLGGFTGSVPLTCADLPSGANCTFSPPSVTLNGEHNAGSIVTVQTSPSLSGGYTIANTGVSGSGDPASSGLTRSTQAFLNVQSTPTAGSRGSGAGNLTGNSFTQDFQAVLAEHPLGMTLALTVILIVCASFIVSMFFAARAVYRELTSPSPAPKT